MGLQKINEELVEAFIGAALAAGRKILEVYNQTHEVSVQYKDDASPLTRADTEAHRAIKEYLTRRFPEVPLLSEEGKDVPYETRRQWRRYFCVDPLDGTKEFIKRNGEFTVNIALIEGDRTRFGVVYLPVQDRLYYGGAGYGSWRVDGLSSLCPSLLDIDMQLIGESDQKLPLQVKSDSGRLVAIGSRSHMNDETRAFFEKLRAEHGDVRVISAGSSIKLCLIAEGTAHVYPRFAPTMEWDTAAGQAIVEGTGGVVRIQESGPLLYNKPVLVNGPFIAEAPQ